MIYLDHNATTPVLPEVFEVMEPWFVRRFANPSSSHPDGVAARQAIELARDQVASLIGAQPDQITFTGGGTEANNLAIVGLEPAVIAISTIEHPAVTQPVLALERAGATVHRLQVGAHGRVVDGVPAGTTLCSVMLANNETGVIQPIAALAAQVHAQGGRMHTDAAQAVGKIPVHVDALGVDLLTIAGHKLYGPKGVGALYVRAGVELSPVLRGAAHERGLRPGTENVPAIVGLGAACAVAGRDLAHEALRVTSLRDLLWTRLQALGALRTGEGPWLPNTLHVRFPGQSGDTLLQRCPELAASTGSACHAGHTEPSAVLLAMGADHPLGALRLTLGRHTTEQEIEAVARRLGTALA